MIKVVVPPRRLKGQGNSRHGLVADNFLISLLMTGLSMAKFEPLIEEKKTLNPVL